MMPADLERLHKYMLVIEHIDQISDQMRAVVAPRKRPPDNAQFVARQSTANSGNVRARKGRELWTCSKGSTEIET